MNNGQATALQCDLGSHPASRRLVLGAVHRQVDRGKHHNSLVVQPPIAESSSRPLTKGDSPCRLIRAGGMAGRFFMQTFFSAPTCNY